MARAQFRLDEAITAPRRQERARVLQIETSVLIQRPLAVVFAFVADIRNSTRWQIGLARFTPETGIAAFEMDRKLGIKNTAGPFAFDAAYHFEPMKDGAQIIWTCRLHAGEPYRFIEGLVGQAMVMETEASFAILKKLLEEGQA